MKEELRKAGKIARRALLLAKKLVKPGERLIYVANKIEEYIIDSGAKPAFPVNISVNHIAAHYTPKFNDPSLFAEGDIVKVDVGAQVAGWIADNALTIDLGDNKKLLKASEDALNSVEKILRADISIGEIGKLIGEVIESYGFKPIRNLTGHEISRWILHAGVSIPNYNNHSIRKLEENHVYAIEPFATNGDGYVTNGPPSGILRINSTKKPREIGIRKIYEFIIREYGTLPFAKRWLYKYFQKDKVEIAVSIMKKQNILYEYPILIERAKGLVSQFEHTYYITKTGFIRITSED